MRGRRALGILAIFFLITFAPGPGTGGAGGQPKTVLKTERFDKDPGWEGHNNHVTPGRRPTVVQDFGFSKTNFAGKAAGELGGRVTRASLPAFYADKIGPLSLD